MLMSVVVMAVSAALFVGLLVHVVKGRGTTVPGVPRAVWLVALLTLDPVVALLYLLLVVFGVARGAACRAPVVYAVLALMLVMRVAPLTVPASGSYPQDSARASAWIPDLELSMTARVGTAGSSVSHSSSRGNGLVARRAVIVADGHPVAAMVVDRIANALRELGIDEVRFVQSREELPAATQDLVVAVDAIETFAIDLLAVAHWQGVIGVKLGVQPFGHDNWIGKLDEATDVGASIMSGRWTVSSTRLGAAWGASRLDHIVGFLDAIPGAVVEALDEVRAGSLVAVATDAGDGSWQQPAVVAQLSPFAPRAIVAGAALFHDAHDVYEIELGGDPAAALAQLSGALRDDGWQQVRIEPANDPVPWWRLTAQRVADGDQLQLRVLPARRAMLPHSEYPRPVANDGDPQATSVSRYIVRFTDRFGTARLTALAERLLDAREDDYLLRLLGSHVPEGRYDDWRSQVLAGDAGVANLSWVARADHERGRDQAAGALLRVAAWVAMTEGTRERAQGELVDATAKDLGVALTAARPDEATLAAAGVSLLADEWRPLPHLLASRREQLGDGQLGAHVRRMVGLDRDGAPVLLHAGIGAAEDGDLRVLLDVDRRARTRRSTSDLEQGAVGTELDGGRLELRRAHDRYEVRWLRPGR